MNITYLMYKSNTKLRTEVHFVCSYIVKEIWRHLVLLYYQKKTFGWVGFESIFMHLEIVSNGKPIKVINDRIDISKSKLHNEPKISPVYNSIVLSQIAISQDNRLTIREQYNVIHNCYYSLPT